jgi:hypothetical protein
METNLMWTVETFGRDCLGNITGYRVERRVWRFTGNPFRRDGLNLMLDIAGHFVADLYEIGSHEKAKAKAEALAAKLNSANSLFPQLTTKWRVN